MDKNERMEEEIRCEYNESATHTASMVLTGGRDKDRRAPS